MEQPTKRRSRLAKRRIPVALSLVAAGGTTASLSCSHHAMTEPLESRQLLSTFTPPADPRVTTSLDADWKFIRSDVSGAEGSAFNDSAWTGVAVPHTWNATDGQDGGNNYYRGIGWYRRHITPDASLAGKRLYLKFDGADQTADLYVNGTLVGEHKGAFAAFGWDVTSLVTPGVDNVIAVKVTNAADANVAPLGGDYTMFGGIYRHVNLIATDSSHVALQEFVAADTSANPIGPSVSYWVNSPGVAISPSGVSAAGADVKVTTSLRNDAGSPRDLNVVSDIVDAAGNLVAELTTTQTVAANSSVGVAQNTHIDNPHLWNGVIDPYLYHVYVSVLDGATLTDVTQQTFGLRSYSIDAASGFILNGQPYDLHGVNFHQDRLNKGWATTDADHAQDVALVSEIGATFVRLSHYQHASLEYDLLDQAGIGMWSEIPVNGTNNAGVSSSTAFLDNAKQQLQEMIRQTGNHPGIFAWGVYNELNDNSTTQSVVAKLTALAHQEDPTRPTTGATNQGDNAGINTKADTVAFNKYYGWYSGTYNDLGPWIDQYHASHPNTAVGVSEYGAGANITQHTANPVSIDPVGAFHPEEYQDLFHEAYWGAFATRGYVWAKLIWNMFDFAADGRNEGNTPGRNDKGLVTYDRATKKDSFYFYKANWSPAPTLYITSRRFTSRTVASTEVKIYSNYDSVTLTVNGIVISTLTVANATNHVFKWPNVQLKAGANTIHVSGVKNGVTATDDATWNLTAAAQPLPTIASLSGTPFARLDFRPATSPAYPDYIADSGLAYADRGNGFSYGWNVDNSGNTRTRVGAAQLAPPPDARYATLVQMQKSGAWTWSMAVPNGTYDVHLVAGDAGFIDSTYAIDLEGQLALSGVPTAAHPWVESSVRVVVTDGRLNMTNDITSANNKICFIDINTADTTPPATTQTSFLFDRRHSIQFRFDEPLNVATLDASDLVLTRLSGTGAIPTPAYVDWDSSTNTAEWVFDVPIDDGTWKAVLPAGSVADVAGNALAADKSLNFFTLAGDADRSGTVDFNDLVVLAQNYGKSDMTFGQGNFNYSVDGLVDFNDLVILAQRYGTSVNLSSMITTTAKAKTRQPVAAGIIQ